MLGERFKIRCMVTDEDVFVYFDDFVCPACFRILSDRIYIFGDADHAHECEDLKKCTVPPSPRYALVYPDGSIVK